MGQYRKKPVVIEARRYTRESCRDVAKWAGTPHVDGETRECGIQPLAISTADGVMDAQPGDWIIKGIEGEFYPCKPSVFEATYEPA